jgi:AcrR family transcriptional regulator
MNTQPVRREAGRPRIFSDEAIFRATNQVLLREGVSELTLEAIAVEVGCTRQALVRRFGSKRALLLAFLDAMSMQLAEVYGVAPGVTDSPLAALQARFSLPPDSRPDLSDNPRVQANLLAFMLTSSSDDPAFAIRFATLNDNALREIERLVQAAIEADELESVDAGTLARVLSCAWWGETLNWCVDPEIDYAASLSGIFEVVVGPYRPRAGK